MDVSRLISEVYKRNGIWDHRTSAHYIRDAVSALWYEIAEVLGAPVDAVKAKWRNLRDTYTAECRKMYKRSRGKEPLVRSKWIWFSAMDFLRPHLKRLRELQEGKPSNTLILPSRGSSSASNRRMRKVLKAEEEDEDDKIQLQALQNVQVDMVQSDTLLQAVTQYGDDDEDDDEVDEDGEDEELCVDSALSGAYTNTSFLLNNNSTITSTTGNNGRKRGYGSAPFSSLEAHLTAGNSVLGGALGNTNGMGSDRKRFKRSLEEELSLREVDDTFHFLISLREPLKSLALDRQMYVRYKIQELLFNETNEHQKGMQSAEPEHVETTPEIISIGNIKIEPNLND